MGDVVKLGDKSQEEELMLICDCGSTTFYVLNRPALICSVCGDEMVDDLSGITHADMQKVQTPASGIKSSEHVLYGREEFALQRTLSEVGYGETQSVVIINKDGFIHSWSDTMESDEQRAWLKKRVDDLPRILLR